MKKATFFILLSILPGLLFAQTMGDVNSSQTIDIIDALMTAQYYVGLSPTGFDTAAADVDGSGGVNIIDALLIAQYYVGIITSFPAGNITPPPESGDYAGDTGAIEPSLAGDEAVHWFAGYERQPDWENSWGIEWGPQHPDQQTLVTGTDALYGGYAYRVHYPAGLSSSASGNQYRCRFDLYEPPLAPRERLFVRYYVRFDPGFTFVKGGKLPGFIGGTANTGGEKPTGYDGFSTRLMWRSNGKVVQYLYHIDQPTEYGEDLEWNVGGQRYFIPGKWHSVETYIEMNSISGGTGNFDGVVRSWFDGELALERTDIRFRHTPDLMIDGFYFSTFFGGSGDDWSPLTNQYATFDNFIISSAPIGPCIDCEIPAPPTPEPGPEYTVVSEITVFDSDNSGWNTVTWGNEDAVYNFNDPSENHTTGGSQSAYIKFSPTAWDAAIFRMPSGTTAVSRYSHISFWLMAEAPDPGFRLLFRNGGSTVSNEVVVDSSPTYFPRGMKAGEWYFVRLPLEDFILTGEYNSILFKTDSIKVHPGFYLDDIKLEELQF